jgi:hypothetical protein
MWIVDADRETSHATGVALFETGIAKATFTSWIALNRRRPYSYTWLPNNKKTRPFGWRSRTGSLSGCR